MPKNVNYYLKTTPEPQGLGVVSLVIDISVFEKIFLQLLTLFVICATMIS